MLRKRMRECLSIYSASLKKARRPLTTSAGQNHGTQAMVDLVHRRERRSRNPRCFRLRVQLMERTQSLLAPTARSGRRWLQFSLRGVLCVLALCAAPVGWYAQYIWPQQRAVNEVLQTGGSVGYDIFVSTDALACFPRQRSVQGKESHVWLDFRHHVVVADAYDTGDPHGICRRLAELPKLNALVLSGKRFDDEALEPIGRITELWDLDLGQTSISDQGVQRLARLSKLELLALPASISDASLEQLQMALPKCSMTRIQATRGR